MTEHPTNSVSFSLELPNHQNSGTYSLSSPVNENGAEESFSTENEENYHQNDGHIEQDINFKNSNSPKSNDLNDEESEFGLPPVEMLETSRQPKFQKDNLLNFFVMSFSSLGCIYGDLGTSPLYVFNTVIIETGGDTSEKTVYGVASSIFWVFTLIVIFKYCLIVLNLGPNNGEGGQVAIYAKIARTLKIGPKGVLIPGDNRVEDLLALTRSETSDSFIKRNISSTLSRDNKFVKNFLSRFILIACFFGCSLVMSDGLLTPTTSVLSSIEGIAVAVPSLHGKTMPIACGVLVCLFIMQRFGSAKISILFAPIIFVWLICLFVIGIINITKHPGVLKSFSPKYAIDFLVDQGSVNLLGPVMLALTGTEAMFADIGHIGKKPIQYTLAFFVYPCLIITYFGQGAFIIENPSLYQNVFYASLPGGVGSGFYWFMFVLATLATIIASQALILGVFSILKQLILLDCFPQLEIIQTSKNYSGQVYIPFANWLLMIGVVCTTVGFKTSANVTSAYGFGISLDFIVTTILIAICMIYVYEMHFIYPLIFVMIFGPLDGALIVANGTKIVHGAWFPLMITILVTLFISFWRWCRSLEVNREYETRVRIVELFSNLNVKPAVKTVDLRLNRFGRSDTGSQIYEDDLDSLEENETIKFDKELLIKFPTGDQALQRYDGVAIMYTNIMHTLNSPNTVPYLLKSLITSFPSLPKVLIFLCVRITPDPFVAEEDRIIVSSMKVPGFYRCVLKFGFMDSVDISSKLISSILFQLEDPRFINRFINQHNEISDDLKVLHIFEKNMIFSKNIVKYNSKVNTLLKPVNLLKQVLIEQIYFQIRNLCYGSEQMISVDDNGKHSSSSSSNQEVLFIGNKVEI